jgi:hypothetical protein
MALAGGVAVGVGFGAKGLLGFSLADGLLPEVLGGTSLWLDPLAALGIVGSFGVTYLGLTWAMGVVTSRGGHA